MEADDGFTLRRSVVYRVLMVGWMVIWSGWLGFLLFGTGMRPPTMFLVIAGLMLVYGVMMGTRTVRQAVIAGADELVVRNTWATHRIPRADLAGFSTGRYHQVGHQMVHADRRSGRSVRLMAAEPPFPLPGRERAVEPTLDRLEAWRTGVRPAVPG